MTLRMHLSAWSYGEAELLTALSLLRIILCKKDELHHIASTNERKRPCLKLLKCHQKLKLSDAASTSVFRVTGFGGSNQKILGSQCLKSMLFSSFPAGLLPERTPLSALELLAGDLADQACTECQVTIVPQKAQALVVLSRCYM